MNETNHKKFMNTYSRIQQIWLILVAQAAKNKESITYTELGRESGLNHRKLGRFLYPIQDYCKSIKGMPPLTILVVLKSTGKPSTGIDRQDFEVKKDDVFQYHWPPPPTEDKFEKWIR